eukprot:CAMPEP_0198113018 /NCGR_PEP_ID=MMETSP1442-20131203/4771_1 /TAXON_ID= /ORGANISM="Craspedostauros australis, Strain CCMP3328" /LENGTH=253 /DNA_ID=CAMNT_0043769993 /DNA_START=329 /DNA_END=1090 /DNA_ORIENTATION=-
MSAPIKKLVVLYGIGGLSDVGRHVVQVLLEQPSIGSVTVLTQHPKKLLEETNWECGCPEPHIFSDEQKKRLNLVAVDKWDDADLPAHFEGAHSVISCLGNRQPGFFDKSLKKGWVSYPGNQMVIRSMKQHGITRAVVITSVGIEEDWPPLEFHFGGKILGLMFRTNTKTAVRDLTQMERAYRSTDEKDIDFLLVRPVGIGEECKPSGKWFLQKEKGKDALGMDMAKLDVARYMVTEALEPTRHRAAVVIGSEP